MPRLRKLRKPRSFALRQARSTEGFRGDHTAMSTSVKSDNFQGNAFPMPRQDQYACHGRHLCPFNNSTLLHYLLILRIQSSPAPSPSPTVVICNGSPLIFGLRCRNMRHRVAGLSAAAAVNSRLSTFQPQVPYKRTQLVLLNI